MNTSLLQTPSTPEQPPQDTEITLGTGRLLGLFVALVVVCALFFSLGYSIGKSSVKGAINLTETSPTQLPPSTGSTAKPSPAASPAAPTPAPATGDDSAKPADNTFPQILSAGPAATPAGATAPPELNKSVATPGTGYVVQVAAVSKQEDAEALVNALKKKDYPVFVAPSPGDRLFHVQLGPFVELKDAESMKTRLANDGYNPIVKR